MTGDDFTDAERALIKRLGISIPRAVPVTKLIVNTEYKTVHYIMICKLCATVTHNYVKMQKVDQATWVKLVDLAPEEVAVENEVSTLNVLICPSCTKVLMQKTKEELVQLVKDVACPRPVEVGKPKPEKRDQDVRVKRRK